MKRRSVALGLTFSPLWGLAQNQEGSRKDSRDSVPYGGGGIRGARADVPEGVLVTDAEAREFQGEAGFHGPGLGRLRAPLPGIDIIQPELLPGLKIKSLFTIAVKFRPLGDAAIDPSTFRVLYGALGMDITSRITKFVNVTEEGFSFEKAEIPSGRHKLVLQIQDQRKRLAERELRFEVE